jgi:hypothetical protein
MTRLLDDVSRCYGQPDHELCQQCARYNQIERDYSKPDISDCHELSYFSRVPSPSGECAYFIQEARHD